MILGTWCSGNICGVESELDFICAFTRKFSVYQNHLKGLVQHRKLDHIPKVFDSVGLGFPDGSVVKKKKKILLPKQETQVQSLRREDSLE